MSSSRSSRVLALELLDARRLLAFSGSLQFVDQTPTHVLTGSAASEKITISSQAGFLTHNHATDPGFNSAFDFDSSQAGDQRVAVSYGDAPTLIVNCGAGDDAVTIDRLSIGGGIGNVKVSGGQGDNTLLLDASVAGGSRSHHLSSTTYDGEGGTVTFGSFQHMSLSCGPSRDYVELGSMSAAATVYGNDGNDTFEIDQDATNIGRIVGGNGLHDALSFDRWSGHLLVINAMKHRAPGEVSFQGIEQFIGSAGDDTLIGSDANETLDGGQGADVLYGNGGDDELFGELVYGGTGNDTLHAQSGTGDQLFGEEGNDRMFGAAGADLLTGGPGADYIHGSNGNDTLDGSGGADHIFGDWGDDLLIGGGSKDKLYGDDGNDSLIGNAQKDRLDGGTGIDIAWPQGHDFMLAIEVLK
jgi:Ca2+-binding RTX toxin-like protein